MKKLFITFGLTILLTHISYSQSLFESAVDSIGANSDSKPELSLHGYARGSVYGGSKKYDLSSAFAELSLQGKFDYKNAFLQSDIRFREGMFFNERQREIQFKELYAGYRSEKFDAFLGNQIIIWGRTDGFNPTNNLTPSDYFFLSSNMDDQKLSNFMLRMKYRMTPSIELELIGIPFYKESNYRYDLFDLNREVAIANLPVPVPAIRVNANFDKIALPERKIKNGSIGARLNFELPQAGFSFSYFKGYDPYHGFDLQNIVLPTTDPTQPVVITYVPKAYLKNTLGADFAIPISDWIFRGEMAYNFVENKDNQMYIPKNDFSYVFGIEKSWNDFIFIGQYIGKRVSDFSPLTEPVLNPADPKSLMTYPQDMAKYESSLFNRKIFNQQEKTNHAMSLTISRSFAYEVWNAELTGFYNFTSEEWLIRPQVSWKISDALALAVGAQYMKGPDKSLFSYSSPVLNGAFAELKVSF